MFKNKKKIKKQLIIKSFILSSNQFKRIGEEGGGGSPPDSRKKEKDKEGEFPPPPSSPRNIFEHF